MLTKELLEAVKSYTANLDRDVTFVVQVGEHEQRAALMEFLTSFASVSDRLHVAERDMGDALRGGASFLIEAGGESTGIVFSGVPGGHEFNSFMLAVLNNAGTPVKLDDALKAIIENVGDSLSFETVVSLSCHNCPDVVQTLNQFASLNANISSEMIDGGSYSEVVDARNIQGVPAVFLNGEPFANGKIDTATIIEKLLAAYPDIASKGATEAEQLPLQDVAIIGGGPAGVSAAIYAARKGFAVTVIAERFGGQVKDTMGIENLVSVPQTTGPEVVKGLLEHLQDYDITLKEHLRVDHIESGDIKTLTLSSGEVIRARSIIVATGANWRELGIPGEKEYIGNGVAYCPHCDGPFFKGKDVAVVGGGNSGIEAAIDLSGIVRHVTVLEFLPELKADKILVEKAMERDNITIITNAASKEINATDGKVSSIDYEDRESGELHSLDLSAVFVQIGLVPNSGFLKGVVDLTEYGEVIINDKAETSEPGIFACGDVTTTPYKQIVVALGEGSKAALTTFEYLVMHAPKVPAEAAEAA
ncbi:MAG: alkyl hydroperoxide reductase subunit F [Pseudomonadota bacterium]